jgi:hypothetical protein
LTSTEETVILPGGFGPFSVRQFSRLGSAAQSSRGVLAPNPNPTTTKVAAKTIGITNRSSTGTAPQRRRTRVPRAVNPDRGAGRPARLCLVQFAPSQ